MSKEMSFNEIINNISTRRGVDLLKEGVEINETNCADIFAQEFGGSWRRVFETKARTVQERIKNDIQSGDIDPSISDNPMLFVSNSIIIHTVEKMLEKTEYFEDIEEVRDEGIHEKIHDLLSDIPLESENF